MAIRLLELTSLGSARLFETDDQRRRGFTRKRLLMILKGNVKAVIRGLRRMGNKAGL